MTRERQPVPPHGIYGPSSPEDPEALLLQPIETTSPQDLERNIVIHRLTAMLNRHIVAPSHDTRLYLAQPSYDTRGRVNMCFNVNGWSGRRARRLPSIPHYLRENTYYHNHPDEKRNYWRIQPDLLVDCMEGTGYLLDPVVYSYYKVDDSASGAVVGRFKLDEAAIDIRLESASYHMKELARRVEEVEVRHQAKIDEIRKRMEDLSRFLG